MFDIHLGRGPVRLPVRIFRTLWKFVVFAVTLAAVFFLSRFAITTFSRVIPDILGREGIFSDEVKIAGTGSMYPTFPKGIGKTDVARAREIVAWSKMRRYPAGFTIAGRQWFGYEIQRGDIVSFSNPATESITKKQYNEELGYVKRVIARGGDKVEIRDGFVILNGIRQKEPYTARPRSTFGGSFLPDCREMTVPPDQLFVLGDNRTGSSDSRHELGFIRVADVDHVLPLSEQKEYERLWRDATGDDKLVSQPTLDAEKFVLLLNEKRTEAGLSKLKLNSKLVSSAKKRGEVILSSNDLSFEATRSGYGMEKALRDAGYTNITWGEAPAIGFYTAEELIENSFQFPDTKAFLLDRDFDDVGVAAVLGQINGCPSQVVVQHFGGFIPPNYTKDVIDNWRKALSNLRDVRPSWTKLRDYPDFYSRNKADVDRMIELIDYRISNMEQIIRTMESNQWLTSAQRAYIDSDPGLYQEQDRLAKTLNSK